MVKKTSTAVAAYEPTEDEFHAALIAAGFITPQQGSEFNRVKVQGSNLVFEDEVIASYNAKTKESMLTIRIADEPREYQAMWFDKDGNLARAVDRPNIAGHMCRSFFDNPAQARKFAEDGTDCNTCPVHPFMPKDRLPVEATQQQGASRCAWRGDLDFQILDKQDDGTLAIIDETIYTISLPTTGMIEFKGSNSKKSGNNLAGSVSEENFNVKLAKLGMAKWGAEGIMKAATALRLGAVVAEVRVLPTSSNEGDFHYNVLSFTPIDILDVQEVAALPDTSESPDPLPTEEINSSESTDELPF